MTRAICWSQVVLRPTPTHTDADADADTDTLGQYLSLSHTHTHTHKREIQYRNRGFDAEGSPRSCTRQSGSPAPGLHTEGMKQKENRKKTGNSVPYYMRYIKLV